MQPQQVQRLVGVVVDVVDVALRALGGLDRGGVDTKERKVLLEVGREHLLSQHQLAHAGVLTDGRGKSVVEGAVDQPLLLKHGDVAVLEHGALDE